MHIASDFNDIFDKIFEASKKSTAFKVLVSRISSLEEIEGLKVFQFIKTG